jgi:hypothetical protein
MHWKEFRLGELKRLNAVYDCKEIYFVIEALADAKMREKSKSARKVRI